MQVELKYKIGEVIELFDRKVRVIGFEYIVGRGIRYVLLWATDDKIDWQFLYEFEIESLK